ncbi:MAG: glycosyltransferase family 2 protein, partial [Alphaproteobacteria bacterium]|nr:glycosyltransferase family 2 protein [Alphaproteobacteria bacterium]
MPDSIPLSVVVVTRGEEASRLDRTLKALGAFADRWIVDSGNDEAVIKVACDNAAKFQSYVWDGQYPKKRQWCLDHLPLAHERVFFVDADEIVTPALVQEIAALDWRAAGYFVKGVYTFDGRLLRHGLHNNKLALFDRRKIEFPVIDDLDIEGMGEIEGHYQPVLKPAFRHERIGQLRQALIHEAYGNKETWERRHWRYALWEVGMNKKAAWPQDPSPWRERLTVLFRHVPYRWLLAFLHSYIL